MNNYITKRKERLREQRQARAEAPERERATGDAGESDEVKRLKQMLQEHKQDMKRDSIPVRGFMNGGHSRESMRANQRLFELKTKLENAQKREE